jgi:hypothetical protein
MATKSIDNQILQYLPLLEKDEKQSILSVIKSFMKGKEKTQRLTVEEYNRELEEAEKRYDAGNFTSHEDVLKEAESW